MSTWDDVVSSHPKVFCAYCGIRDTEHFELSRADIRWLFNHPRVCDRPREGLPLVGLLPDDGCSWIEFVSRETGGAVTEDERKVA